jgi:cystathionine beta-lyase/cystathionine gamma-synthase
VADDPPPVGAGPVPVLPPIHQTSLFAFPDFASLLDGLAHERQQTVYSRGRNPTVRAVERKLAGLERGEDCICFASGMAAVSAAMLGLLEAGNHVLFVNQVYGPTRQLAAQLARFGVGHDVVLDLDPAAVRAALRPATRLVWLESPGTMLFRVADIAAVAALAHEHGALLCVDNSWATPLLQKPLELGADLVVHSATKYLAGHSDLVAGALVTSAARAEQIFYRAYMLGGAVLGPFDAWLLLRGLRTLPVRLRQHEADALTIVERLERHPAVAAVHHPARSARPDLVERQLRGTSGLLSFELRRRDFASVVAVLDRLRCFRLGVSWGGVESVALSPQRSGDPAPLAAQGIPPGLIRLSVGLEGAGLLGADLEQALEAAP